MTQAKWSGKIGAQVLSIAAGANQEAGNGDFEICKGTTVTPQTDASNPVTTWGLELTTSNSTNANKLNNDKAYMMIIPQDLRSDGFRVYVEYDVVTKADWESETPSSSDHILTNTVTTKNVQVDFESGKAYTLNLQLGMTSAKISASVEPWYNSESNPVTDTTVKNPANN